MATFRTKVAGVTFEGRQDAIKSAKRAEVLDMHARFKLRREPDNEYDHNAVAVDADGAPIGFLPRDIAAQVAPVMDAGGKTRCWEPIFVQAGKTIDVTVKVRVRKLKSIEGALQTFEDE